jgi:hypothetical protein
MRLAASGRIALDELPSPGTPHQQGTRIACARLEAILTD